MLTPNTTDRYNILFLKIMVLQQYAKNKIMIYNGITIKMLAVTG